MPLTAFSASRQMELDVDQLLQYLADSHQRGKLKSREPIPDTWKQTIHSDLECPACFVKGGGGRQSFELEGNWGGNKAGVLPFSWRAPPILRLCHFAAWRSSARVSATDLDCT